MAGCCNHGHSDISLKVSGMSCGHCKAAVEKAVGALPGVSKVKASVEEGKVEVSYKPQEVSLDDIKQAIEQDMM